MGNSIDAQTTSQTPDNVSHAAPAGEEHAEPKTINVQAAADELHALGPLVTGFLVPADSHPIEADAKTKSPTAVGTPSSQSYTQLIDDLLVEADMATLTFGSFRRLLERKSGQDLKSRKVGFLAFALRNFITPTG